MKWDNMTIKRLFLICVGAFLNALSINVLLLPQGFLTGGFAGIAMLLHYIFRWPVGFTVFMLNVPLFILAFMYISRRFVIFSLVGMAALSLSLMVTSPIKVSVSDPWLGAIFGGVMAGLGSGIVFRQRGSLGGTDIVAVLVNKYYSFNIGTVIMISNIIILVVAALIYNISLVLYSIISIFISSQAMDSVQSGLNRRKTVLIVTEYPNQIAARIIEKMHRGVTFLHGEGAYTHRSKKLIYCDVNTIELARLKELVTKIDEDAFVTIMDAREVMGKGFSVDDSF